MDLLEQPGVLPGPSANAVRVPVYDSSPACIAASQMSAFTEILQNATGQVFNDYRALHDFSVRDFRTFWQCFLQWSQGLGWSGNQEPVCVGDTCEQAQFFPQLRFNYADRLLDLSVAAADAPALTACYADGRRVRLTRGALREQVARLADALSALGLGEGDRVVGVMRNDADAVIAALAVTALGATLSTAAPEMGVESIIDRFGPLTPTLLLAHTASRTFDTGNALAANIADLVAALPSLQGVVCLDDAALPASVVQPTYALGALIAQGDAARFVWRHFPFNHPLFIMFSSGTTGKPKCIVHGAGGSLLEHLKEHRLHTNLRPGERLFFYTSCAWMMWNWQLSALASGVEIVTYDGPIVSVDKLWRLVSDERVNVFGTSPAYLKMCEDAALSPGRQFDLGALRAMLSTGAVLFDAQYAWVRDHVKALPLQSISGGTDILGCFVLGNPNLPVYAGEAQCKSLGLDVQAWAQGASTSGIGQLVCANPFPSRPIGFFGDADGARFHAAYFASNPGVWIHGDLIEFSQQGSARLHGRSDGVLNVRGINVGPGEIYRVLSEIPQIRAAMVVEQRVTAPLPVPLQNDGPGAPGDSAAGQARANGFEQRIVLLLVLREGVTLTATLAARVRRELARCASPAHVPDRIIAVDELPVTHSGKLCDAAARDAVNGWAVANVTALRNPACLDVIRNHPALNQALRPIPPIGDTREQLERHLQAQWEKLFGFAPVGRDDNFFELGGNSLLAARFLAALQDSTAGKVQLALAALLIAPTVAQLAAMIYDKTRQPPSAMLLPVRIGTGAPIFLVHGVSGSVMECWALVMALQSTRPVYGLQARGLDGELPAQSRVEDMAASYIEQMRSVQPSGPYAIIGYSFGGLVAFEIAQQLLCAGQQVELLCLLDTYVDLHCLSWQAWLQLRAAAIRREWRRLKKLPPSRRLGSLTGKLRSTVGRMVRPPKKLPGTMPPVLWQVREKMWQAMATYRPLPYAAGRILYVRAAVEQMGLADPLPLWRRVARGGLVIADVPGNHNEMIVEPNAHAVALVLDQVLSQLKTIT